MLSITSSPIRARFLSRAICSILLLLGSHWASAQYTDLPELHVPRVHTPIVVDGKLDESCWKDATRFILTDPWKQTGHPLDPTEVRLICTNEALYIAFLAQDSEIIVNHTARDERTHKDDCVEVFLGRPRETIGEALGMEINANGVVADFYYRHAGWINYGWEPEIVRIATQRDNAVMIEKSAAAPGYTAEIKIPWKELLYALPEKEIPTRLRANFARWDYGSNGRIFSIWSDPQLAKPGPYRLDRFGWLIFD